MMRTRVHPLVFLIEIALILMLIIHLVDDSVVEKFVYPAIASVAIFSYHACLYTMWRKTERMRWTYLGAGLFATMLADAWLLLYLQRGSFGLDFLDETWIEIVASLLAVGGPFVLWGLRNEWRVEDDHSVIQRSD